MVTFGPVFIASGGFATSLDAIPFSKVSCDAHESPLPKQIITREVRITIGMNLSIFDLMVPSNNLTDYRSCFWKDRLQDFHRERTLLGMSVLWGIHASTDLAEAKVTPAWRRHHINVPLFDGEMIFTPLGAARDFSFWLRLKTQALLFLVAF
jgi:hypothetical protein